MKYYTLYYQLPSSGRRIAVATSKSLIKLCKIQATTFYNRKCDTSFIMQKGGNTCCLLTDCEYEKLRRFNDSGKYYKSYDYAQRVRELLNRRV